MTLEYQHAIRAVARGDDAAEIAVDGMDRCKEWLDGIGAFATERRLAAFIGQSAHESAGFSRLVESLNYSVEGLAATFGTHRISVADRERLGRIDGVRAADQEAIANTVYGGEWGRANLGNTEPGDGWRFRGRGWLQLTGRSNYRTTGGALGIDLEADPGLATDPKVAWQIAAHFLSTRKRAGRTAFEWADDGDAEAVTRIINGGTHGLADRRALTGRALAALA